MYKKFNNAEVFTSADANALMRQGIIALEGTDVTAANVIETPTEGMKVLINGTVYTRRGLAWISEYPPAPQTSYTNTPPANLPDITSTTWAGFTGGGAVALSLPLVDTWVDVRFGGALRASGGSAGSVSLGFYAQNGGFTVAPDSIGAVPITHASGITTEAVRYHGSRIMKLTGGSWTFALHAKQAGGGTRKVEYGYIEVVPLRWSN